MRAKRFLICLLTLLLLVSTAAMAVSARGDDDAKLSYVTDIYGLLSQSEAAALEERASALSENYGCSLYILVVKDYTEYADSTFAFTTDVFDTYKLGWGSEKTGVLLMLSMADRDYELHFHGSLTDAAFTEYGRDKMEERFLQYFRENDFAGGFQEYLTTCGEYLQAERDGNPVDKKTSPLVAIIPGVLAAMGVGGGMTASMHSEGRKRDADAYIAPGSVKLHAQSDTFTHRTVTRTPRQTSSSRSSSGSSHHSGSHSGRSGKF